MSIKTVAPYATKDLSVPIGQKIAISTNGGDNVTIWYQTNAGVSPVGWYVHDVITNEAVLLGTFTGVRGVRIETQSSPALYNIGVSPTIGVGDASTLNGYTQDATATADTIALRDSNGDIQANAFESTVATGTAPLTVASITKVANLNADLLDDLNSATASTASTVAARDASGNLTANVLISDVAIGTAPLTVTSTTKAANFNADLLDDQEGSYYLNATNISSGTLADARLSSNVDLLNGDQTITGVKTIANDTYLYLGTTGAASVRMQFESGGDLFGIEPRGGGTYNGKVLYYDGLTDDWSVNGFVIIDESKIDDTPVNGQTAEPISSNWAYDHVAAADPHAGYMLESNIGTGNNNYLQLNGSAQIPAVSGALLTSVNADQTDGYDASETSTVSTLAARDASANLTANVLVSDVAIGTAPLTVTSTTKVANLNADLLDDLNTATASTASTIAARNASGNLTANVLVSDVATGTAPLTVTSTTVVPNLNVSSLSGLASSQFLRSDANDYTTGTFGIGAASPIEPLYVYVNDADDDYPIAVFHNNTGGTRVKITGNGDTSDAVLHFITDANGSAQDWAVGIDGDDSDKFKIGHSYLLANNNVLALATDGSATFAGTVAAGAFYQAQGAQTAKTTSTTLTAAEINTGIITVNNGAAGTTTLTLPLATAMDSQFTGVAAGYSWDFSVVNISTTAAEDADVGTNTGWTLVGNMDIEADDDPRARSSAKFRARKTGTGAWTLYRMA
jgi:hypothetical protein